ncbi:MAG TPA: YwbE family protein [Candidatus Methanofastidiosa archaeon]|nr:YwbE family protein [Candidatus Methanofastidiosa archaeon]
MDERARHRGNIRPGTKVTICLNEDRSKFVDGEVIQLLTRSAFHPHGIKVRLTDGRVGRVKEILV